MELFKDLKVRFYINGNSTTNPLIAFKIPNYSNELTNEVNNKTRTPSEILQELVETEAVEAVEATQNR